MLTDRQLAVYLGIIDSPKWPAVIRALNPQIRKTYERMSDLEAEIDLWQNGLGPKPSGVLIDAARTPAKARAIISGLRRAIQKRHQR